MIVVIIAGGSGTRLWPLSTPEKPKHLLTLSGEESLLQSAYHRAKALTNDIYVITEIGHAASVKEQLPELTDDAFIIEPARRGTMNCVLAGLSRVADKHSVDEPVAFIPADHHIRDIKGFSESFRIAGEASQKHGKVTLVGVEPTYPSTGLGYIHKNGRTENGSLVYTVLNFKEKPPFNIAKEYVQSGEYLWNCSYFIGSVNVFMKTIETYAPEQKANYEKLRAAKNDDEYTKAYMSFEIDTIDYALSEKTASGTLLVVPASFDWMDVGSFKDAHDVVENDEAGNHVRGFVGLEEVENSYIRNEEADKPVAVIGLDNVVVINTPNGILVARKDLAQNVKTIVEKFNAAK